MVTALNFSQSAEFALVNTLKRNYLVGRDLSSAKRILEQIDGWFEDYNTYALYSSLEMKVPAEYRREQQTLADTGCLTK